MAVFVQLDIAVFHNLKLKVFFQFPPLLGQWFQMSFFDVPEQIIVAFFSALKRKAIMYLRKLKDGFVKSRVWQLIGIWLSETRIESWKLSLKFKSVVNNIYSKLLINW